MTHREIVIRLAEAYIKAGATIEAEKIIRIADYFMANTTDTNYSTGSSWISAINSGAVTSKLYCDNSTKLTVANEPYGAEIKCAELVTL